ncbi:MAG: MipA/OmpV family protein, partial [Alphaproteobacteria bacterium]|nr:MipA/OmpV family protein [Alphaproteobacteria bacterium]
MLSALRFALPWWFFLCLVAPAQAGKEKPLFELGLLGGVGYLPDYPAAGESRGNGIVLPYLAYRGEFIRSDDKGFIRGRLIHSRDLELDISLSGSLKADSDDNDDRRGMPDLDYLAEFGPRLQWTVARAARWAKIDLELPLRAVFSTDLSDIDHQGFLAQPEIAYQHDNFLDTGARVKLGLSAIFADEDLQDYFYEVPVRFATARRRTYDADGGYLGSRL